ncbi:hypothetical protein PVAND_015215 [Polypedilum vanderplanki]|uniref:NACHT domain-containing protein n=1 Tax=Polypedilum vanderplanki TaxID=319348 RepID=A0A9J6BCE2_POLVA|nr:hypothetical protein PVAND_015215 [Polypedilum vanderplanki]
MDPACSSQNIQSKNHLIQKIKYNKNFTKFIKKVKSIKTNSKIKHIKIENVPTIQSASKITSNFEFTKFLFRKLPSLNVLMIKINNEIKNVIEIKNRLFKTRKKFLLTFESTTKNQIILFWKNTESEGFLNLNLIDENVAFSVKLLAKEFIIEILSQKDGAIEFCSNEKFDLSTLISKSDVNLLFEAVFKKNLQLVKEILKLSIDVNWKIYRIQNNNLVPYLAIDIAWRNRNFKIVYELLNANSMFPKEFNQIEASEKSSDIKKFIQNVDWMTKAITNNNIEEVKLILKTNSHLCYFFNVYNVSSIRLAVRKQNLEIYRIFSESGVSFGPDESFNEKCNEKFIRRLCDYNSSAAQPLPEIHIMILLSKSVVTQNDKNLVQRLIQIRESFETLNLIAEIKPVLKILALDKKTKFFFDFTQNSIVYMNPQVRGITRAAFDHTKHHIQIAAKSLLNDYTKNDFFGLLSHECHHSGFNKVYMNNRLPYAKDDEKNKEKFDEIIIECKNSKGFEPIVEEVYKYYESDAWGRELAVRVPHMLTTYKNDQIRLEILKLKYKNLFDFHYKVVLPEFKAVVEVFEKLVDDENKISFDELTSSLKSAIKHSWVEFQGVKIQLKAIAQENILMQLESSQIREILNGQILNICENLNYVQDFFYKERNFIDNEFDKEKYFHWYNNELTEDAKEASKEFESILIEVNQTKIFLLSDHAGAGKSTTMKNLKMKIKERFPQNLVEFVDLKRHLRVYEHYKNDDLNEKESIINVLVEILSFNKRFEIEIFKNLFLSDRIILLFDGVDEIAPIYTKFFFKLIKSIKNLTKNQQWISTRPQHTQELKEIFKQKIYKFLPFDENQAKEFVNEYLKSKKFTGDDKNVFVIIRKYELFKNPLMLKMVADLQINGKLSNNYENESKFYKDFIEMKRKILNDEKGEIANLDRDKNSKLTLWEIHQIYALKLLFNHGFSFFEVNIKFDEFQLFKKWKKEKSKWSPEAISRYGFVFVENWNTDKEFPDFTHRTFAEYFAAEFIYESTKEAIEDGDDLTKNEFELRMKFALYIFEQHSKNPRVFKIMKQFIKNFLTKKEIETCSEIFKNFMKQKIVVAYIEKSMFSEYTENIEMFSIIFEILKFSYYNEEFFKIFSFSLNEYKTLFQLTINGNKNSYYSCELFEIYRKSNFSNWHQLTGLGQNLSEEIFKLKMCDENLDLKDFLTQNEACEDYMTIFLQRTHFVSYNKNDEEEFETLKIIDQLFSFMIIVDNLKIDNFEKFFEVFIYEFTSLFLRSKKIIEKLFKVVMKYFENVGDKLEKFACSIKTTIYTFSMFHDNNVSKVYLDNFTLFFKNIEDFFISKTNDEKILKELIHEMFAYYGSNILIFTIHHKVDFMKKFFRKYFELNELSFILVENYSIERDYIADVKNIKNLNEFCKESLEFQNYFQLNFFHNCNLHKFLNFFIDFKKCYPDNWTEQTGFVRKTINKNLSEESLIEIANQIFPENKEIKNKIREVDCYVNLYQLLCFINEHEIPLNHLEIFFLTF